MRGKQCVRRTMRLQKEN